MATEVKSLSKGSSRSAQSITSNVEDLWQVYHYVKPLGCGSFGVVREVKSKDKGHHFALKTIPLTADNEVTLMLKLEHPNILRLQQVVVEGSDMHLVMDLCSGGDLQAWMEDRWDDEFTSSKVYDSPGTSQVAVLCKQMLSAVAYMHSACIAHRDIKPGNWLLTNGLFPILKLSDFGLGQSFEPGQVMDQACGSRSYMAPEVYSQSYTELCDVWSSGMVFFELVCGEPLFGNIPDSKMESAVCGKIQLDQKEWKQHRPWLRDWIQSLLVLEPERPSAEKALRHPEVQRATWNGRCQCTVF